MGASTLFGQAFSAVSTHEGRQREEFGLCRADTVTYPPPPSVTFLCEVESLILRREKYA